jgi:aubergine-like protein
VVYNTLDFEKKDIEAFTYHLCYGYVNWVGSIKVPHVCMYAKKIAAYSSDYKIEEPNPKLSDSLHFI